MLSRLLRHPKDSFFLFGPRGTGKSTLLRQWFPRALWFDLLNQQEFFQILRSPAYFAQAVSARPKNEWVVVDEVQKAPQILDEVHRLIEVEGRQFALSGSSARKLKRGGANLLAGRALVYHLFPLTLKELGNGVSIEKILEFGLLPKIALEKERAMKIERLNAYVNTYLAEEIKAESIAKNLDSFGRFLSIASLANGQVTNLSNISRDAGVARPTVTSYFQILEDTLLGRFLPAWLPRYRVKEVNHPKFYLFDCGVLRALTDRLGERPTPEEKGILLETLIYHELQSAQEYLRSGGQFSYWRTHDGIEVDFVWRKADRMVAVEVKSSDYWKPNFGKGLHVFKNSSKFKVRTIGVYLGERRLKQDFVEVFPLNDFVQALYSGDII